MTHWILLILAILTSGLITRYQYFCLGRDVGYVEGVLVSLVIYIVLVLISNKYFTKGMADNDKLKEV